MGWDMTAALSLAQARGMDLSIVAELLPLIERSMAMATNQELDN